LPAVFEIVHHFPDHSATAIGGNRRVEMQDAILAIGARERVGDGTREGL
jgi:hypothetical protein